MVFGKKKCRRRGGKLKRETSWATCRGHGTGWSILTPQVVTLRKLVASIDATRYKFEKGERERPHVGEREREKLKGRGGGDHAASKERLRERDETLPTLNPNDVV